MTTYDVEWREQGSGTLVGSVSGISATEQELTGIDTTGDYEFRVRAEEDGVAGEWSDWFQFEFEEAAPDVTGTATNTLQALAQAATGAQANPGTATNTLQALTQAAEASVGTDATGEATNTLQALTQAAEGATWQHATGEATNTLQALTQSAEGSMTAQGVVLSSRSFVIVPRDGVMNFRDPLGKGEFVSPGEVYVTLADRSVDEDAGTITVYAGRSGGDGAVSVQYQTIDGSAEAGTDYESKTGQIDWGDGDTANKPVTITITDRSGEDLNDREFDWQIHTPDGAEIRTNEDGSLQDTTRVLIRDVFDGASDDVDVLWNGDYSTGDFLQWHQPGDPTSPRMNLIPPYGRPPEWGGNGDLCEIVTSPTRGHSPYSARMTVKNGSNWNEPDDCKPFPCDRNLRTTRLNGRAQYTDDQVMPQFSSWWWTTSVFIPNSWDPQGGGWGPAVDGLKCIDDGAFALFTLSLTPVRWGFTHRHDPEGVANGSRDLEWWHQMRYRETTGIGDGGFDSLEVDFPDPSVSRAAFASINKGGWTDWMFHIHPDWRDPGSVNNNGFFKVYKREDSGPVIHVVDIQPLSSISIGPNTFPRGIGLNSDFFWCATQGIYAPKVHFENASSNQTLYFTNSRVYSGSNSLSAVANHMLGN